MSSTLHLVKPAQETDYESAKWFESESIAGVRYSVTRMSFGRRIELARSVREIARKAEFFEAAADPLGKLEAAVISAEVDRVYLEWGVGSIEGLLIDGTPADVRALIESGPVNLSREILARIKAESGLSEDERKN